MGAGLEMMYARLFVLAIGYLNSRVICFISREVIGL